MKCCVLGAEGQQYSSRYHEDRRDFTKFDVQQPASKSDVYIGEALKRVGANITNEGFTADVIEKLKKQMGEALIAQLMNQFQPSGFHYFPGAATNFRPGGPSSAINFGGAQVSGNASSSFGILSSQTQPAKSVFGNPRNKMQLISGPPGQEQQGDSNRARIDGNRYSNVESANKAQSGSSSRHSGDKHDRSQHISHHYSLKADESLKASRSHEKQTKNSEKSSKDRRGSNYSSMKTVKIRKKRSSSPTNGRHMQKTTVGNSLALTAPLPLGRGDVGPLLTAGSAAADVNYELNNQISNNVRFLNQQQQFSSLVRFPLPQQSSFSHPPSGFIGRLASANFSNSSQSPSKSNAQKSPSRAKQLSIGRKW